MKIIILGLLASLILSSCSYNKQDLPQSAPSFTDWNQQASANVERLLKSANSARYTKEEIEHLQWVAKASFLLRGKKDISFESDNIDQLKTMSKEDVADHFLNSEDFLKTIVDFSLYFSGFRLDPLTTANDQLNSRLFEFSGAITAAQAIAQDQSFFNFFKLKQPFYIEPLGPVDDTLFTMFDFAPPSSPLLSDSDKRTYFFSNIINKLSSLSVLTTQQLKVQENEVCDMLYRVGNFGSDFNNFSSFLGFTTSLQRFATEAFPKIPPPHSTCTTKYIPEESKLVHELISSDEAKRDLLLLVPYFQQLQLVHEPFDSSKYMVKKITDIKTVDANKYGELFSYRSGQIAPHLANSSTNMNRKRGAYILKHFFCDDLTPVNVKISDDHAKDVHGSNPSCFACHYKLDPMSGFFKDYGLNFADFSTSQKIVFDDQAETDVAQYQKQWLKPNGKSWNIGYIQSTQYEHLNRYGENLDDLHKILQTAPEVKRCMVKRALEYATSPQQIFDPGFVEEIATLFSQEELQSPKRAMQKLFKRLALSKTFTKINPDANECYDLKLGADITSRPPCQIAHILETNCVKCHSSGAGKTSLDLSKWIVTADGTMGFSHIDKTTGLQKKSQETFNTMLDRITSSYDWERMPPGDMNPVYRQVLFQWLSQKEVKK